MFGWPATHVYIHMLIDVADDSLRFQAISRASAIVDSGEIASKAPVSGLESP